MEIYISVGADNCVIPEINVSIGSYNIDISDNAVFFVPVKIGSVLFLEKEVSGRGVNLFCGFGYYGKKSFRVGKFLVKNNVDFSVLKDAYGFISIVDFIEKVPVVIGYIFVDSQKELCYDDNTTIVVVIL